MIPVMARYAYLVHGCVEIREEENSGVILYKGKELDFSQDQEGEKGDIIRMISFYDLYHGKDIVIDEETSFSVVSKF